MVFDNSDFLRAAKSVADEKGLSSDTIIKTIESAVQIISRKKYGNCKIKVEIDRKTGVMSSYRLLVVTDDQGNITVPLEEERDTNFEIDQEEEEGIKYGHITLSEALKNNAAAKIGDIVYESLPNIDLNYHEAKIIKSEVAHKIRIEERKKQLEEFLRKKKTLVHGIVKRVDSGSVIVDLNGNEAVLFSQDLIRGEIFRPGDKIKTIIEDVRENNGPQQIFLSRTSNGFMEQLFAEEITEVYDKIVTVKAIARDPGSRAKVAVFSSDKNIDPVGACVGPRGSRIQSITSELHGEKIDVILYSSNLPEFAVNAISPAEVLKVIIDDDIGKVVLVVPEDQISLAIGRKGQNIKLASELIGWKIDIVGDAAESNRRTEELATSVKLLIEALDVEEIIAQLLYAENYVSIEDINNASVDDIASIEGFNKEIAEELKNRAAEYLNSQKEAVNNLNIDKQVAELPFLEPEDLTKLFEHGIKTLEDIAELSTDEFCEIAPNVILSQDKIDKLIIEARKRMGWL